MLADMELVKTYLGAASVFETEARLRLNWRYRRAYELAAAHLREEAKALEKNEGWQDWPPSEAA